MASFIPYLGTDAREMSGLGFMAGKNRCLDSCLDDDGKFIATLNQIQKKPIEIAFTYQVDSSTKDETRKVVCTLSEPGLYSIKVNEMGKEIKTEIWLDRIKKDSITINNKIYNPDIDVDTNVAFINGSNDNTIVEASGVIEPGVIEPGVIESGVSHWNPQINENESLLFHYFYKMDTQIDKKLDQLDYYAKNSGAKDLVVEERPGYQVIVRQVSERVDLVHNKFKPKINDTYLKVGITKMFQDSGVAAVDPKMVDAAVKFLISNSLYNSTVAFSGETLVGLLNNTRNNFNLVKQWGILPTDLVFGKIEGKNKDRHPFLLVARINDKIYKYVNLVLITGFDEPDRAGVRKAGMVILKCRIRNNRFEVFNANFMGGGGKGKTAKNKKMSNRYTYSKRL